MALKFTGDETLPQMLDRLLVNAQELYGKEIRVMTLQGSYQGEFAGKGSSLLILKTKTGRFVNAEGRQEVIQTHLVALNSITGISFETLNATE